MRIDDGVLPFLGVSANTIVENDKRTENLIMPIGDGFAICRKPDGEILRSSSQVSVDGEIDILLHQGELKVRVTNALPGGIRTSKEK